MKNGKYKGLDYRIVTTLIMSSSLIILCVAGKVCPNQAYAQGVGQLSRSYITAFPENDRYQIMIFGDSLAEGVYAGLRSALETDRRMEIKQSISYGASMFRSRRLNWPGVVENSLKNDKIDIAVIMLGINERRSLRKNRKKVQVGSEDWKQIYGRRVDQLMKKLKRSGKAIYWVGLPIMRRVKDNTAMQSLNDVYREKAFLNEIKFIDTWNGFADQYGRFSAYGPDLTGKVRRIRADDGIHFTYSGYLKLAHFVEREIRRDLAMARKERNIPLAGDEEEQRRIIEQGRLLTNARNRRQANGVGRKNSFFFGLGKKPRVLESSSKKRSLPKSKTVKGIKIVRPVLSDTIISSVAASRQFVGLSLQDNTTLANDIEGELTSLASVSQSSAIGLKNAKQRVPLTQTPYYKVLIKGEAVKPKKGRADDFTWSE